MQSPRTPGAGITGALTVTLGGGDSNTLPSAGTIVQRRSRRVFRRDRETDDSLSLATLSGDVREVGWREAVLAWRLPVVSLPPRDHVYPASLPRMANTQRPQDSAQHVPRCVPVGPDRLHHLVEPNMGRLQGLIEYIEACRAHCRPPYVSARVFGQTPIFPTGWH